MLDCGKNVFELLGAGYTLIAIGTSTEISQAVSHFRTIASETNLPLTVITTAPDCEAARYAAALILVRPDAFVAWTGRPDQLDAQDVRDILQLVQSGDFTYSASQAHAAAGAG